MRRFVLVLSALALACSGAKSRKLFLFHSNDEHSHLLGFVPEADDFPAPPAVWQLKASALAAGNYDGDSNYTQVFDANTTGWLSVSPLQPVTAAASLYIASFATFAGVHLKDPNTGSPIPGNNPAATILNRADTTEVKEWESLASYISTQSAANGGALPVRYSKADQPNLLPRRAVCTGANAVAGNCSH
jgi:hypothetical protein